MVLIVVALLLILGIAFFQVTQGLFSSLIMAILTILCAAVAFTYYEPLAQLLYTRQPAHADAVSLIALLVIPLLILRIVFDRFLGGNVVFSMWANRIGGGLLGLLTGMVLVGVLAVAVQLLPFDASMMTYRPFDGSLHRRSGLAPFYPDEFTLGLMKRLSAGSLKSKRQFGKTHDDLLLDGFAARNTAEKFGRRDAWPDDLKSVAAFEAPEAKWRDDVPEDPLVGPGVPTKDYVVRFTLDKGVRDEVSEDDESQAEYFRLPATQFRLAAMSGRSYYPVAYLTFGKGGWQASPAPRRREATQAADLIVARPFVHPDVTDTLAVDWVYRIPADEKPRYVAFRRTVRQAIGSPIVMGMPPAQGALDRSGSLESLLRSSGRR